MGNEKKELADFGLQLEPELCRLLVELHDTNKVKYTLFTYSLLKWVASECPNDYDGYIPKELDLMQRGYLKQLFVGHLARWRSHIGHRRVKGAEVAAETKKTSEKGSIKGAATSTRAKSPPTLTQFMQGCELAGIPKEFSTDLYRTLEGFQWLNGDGTPIRNWQRYAKAAYNSEKCKAEREAAAAEPTASGFRRITEDDL